MSEDNVKPSEFEIHRRMVRQAAEALKLSGSPDWTECVSEMMRLRADEEGVEEAFAFERPPVHEWETFDGGRRFFADGGSFYFFEGDSKPHWVPEPPLRFLAELPTIIQSAMQGIPMPGVPMGMPMPDIGPTVVPFPGVSPLYEVEDRLEPCSEPYEIHLDTVVDSSDPEGDFEVDKDGRVTVFTPRRMVLLTGDPFPFHRARLIGIHLTVEGIHISEHDEVPEILVEDISTQGGFNLLDHVISLWDRHDRSISNWSIADGSDRLDVKIRIDDKPIIDEEKLIKLLIAAKSVPVKIYGTMLVEVLE